MTYLLAQATDAATSFDWPAILTAASLVITAIGGVLVALLQALGKKDAAAKAEEATAALGATIKGVEVAARDGDFTDLTKELKKRTGLELTPEQLSIIASGATKVVKGSIRATSMEHSVAGYLAALVESKTVRVDLTPEQRAALKEDAKDTEA